jgi:G-protein signaling modulator 2
MGQHKEAYHYAMRHLEISRDTGDTMGQTTAQMNLNELSRYLAGMIGLPTKLLLLLNKNNNLLTSEMG